jgi:hypothetical protein
MSSEMMTNIVDLGMAVMTAGDAIIRTGGHNLVKFNFPVGAPFFGEAGLQEPAATTTTVIIGLIWGHLDDIFLTHHRLDDKSQVISDFVTFAFADNLAGILNRKLDFSVLIPGGTDFESALSDPFGIVGINRSNFKLMVDIEFFQSSPD